MRVSLREQTKHMVRAPFNLFGLDESGEAASKQLARLSLCSMKKRYALMLAKGCDIPRDLEEYCKKKANAQGDFTCLLHGIECNRGLDLHFLYTVDLCILFHSSFFFPSLSTDAMSAIEHVTSSSTEPLSEAQLEDGNREIEAGVGAVSDSQNSQQHGPVERELERLP
jgi:hypothetical protein